MTTIGSDFPFVKHFKIKSGTCILSIGGFANHRFVQTFEFTGQSLKCDTFEDSTIEFINITNVNLNKDGAFRNCLRLKTLVINQKTISNYFAFNCINLETVTCLALVTSIGMFSFAYCAKLKSFDFTSKMNILSGAFLYSGIESLTIGTGFNQIGSLAFAGSNLKTLKVMPSSADLEIFCTANDETLSMMFIIIKVYDVYYN